MSISIIPIGDTNCSKVYFTLSVDKPKSVAKLLEKSETVNPLFVLVVNDK